MPHAQGKCIVRAKAQKISKVPEPTDLYGDADSKERSLDYRCQHGSAALAVACLFCGTKEKGGARQNPDDAVDDGCPSTTASPLAKLQGIFPENSTWDSDACSVFALHSCQNAAISRKINQWGQNAESFRTRVLIDLICSGMVSQKQFCRLTCQRGSASQMMRGRY